MSIACEWHAFHAMGGASASAGARERWPDTEIPASLGMRTKGIMEIAVMAPTTIKAIVKVLALIGSPVR